MKLKTMLATISALCLCAVYLPITELSFSEAIQLSASAEESGTCGENLTWILDNEGTLIISGTGKMTDWQNHESPWRNLSNRIKSICIEDGVTTIGNHAFRDCQFLNSVVIPASVGSIGEYAFTGCMKLYSITIPDNVESIGRGAFLNCYQLNAVTLPNGIKCIEDLTFHSCIVLNSIIIPDSVEYIGQSAFNSCYELNSITIPNSVTSIGAEAFYQCTELTSITIPNSVNTISDHLFCGCSNLTSVTIPESVMSIEQGAFLNCTNLTSITIQNPNCEIFDLASTISNGKDDHFTTYFYGTIYGHEDSTVQAYAEKYGYPFALIGSDSEELQEGDANGDGEINILDVIAVNKAIMGKATLTETQLKAIDFNGNNKPDAEESLTLLKYIVGLITEFE